MEKTFIELFEEYKTTDSISFAEKFREKIDERTDIILKKIYDIYNVKFAPSRKFVNWWAWEYYEDEYMSGPEFDISKNFNIVNGVSFIHLFVDGIPIMGLINGKEIEISTNIPLKWFDYSEQDLEDAIIHCINCYKIHLENEKEIQKQNKALKKKEKIASEAIKKEVINDLYKKLTEKELWAVGLRKSYPEYHDDIFHKTN